MTTTPAEERISMLRKEARALLIRGEELLRDAAFGDTIEDERILMAMRDPPASSAAQLCAGRAARYAWSRDVGQTLHWLEQCEAHLKSDRLARAPSFGARR